MQQKQIILPPHHYESTQVFYFIFTFDSTRCRRTQAVFIDRLQTVVQGKGHLKTQYLICLQDTAHMST